MTGHSVAPRSRRTQAGRGNWRAAATAMALALTLGACSSVPDYANPVEWYHSATDTVGGWFSDDEPATEKAPAPKPASSSKDEKYPNLASVPEKPKAKSSAEERAKLKAALASDRANARYTGQESKTAAASGATSAPKPAPAPSPVAAAPAPRPAAKPVKSAPPPQQARLSSGIYAGQRSSLWPNSPPPVSKGDRATTSASVGKPVVSGRVASVAPRAAPVQPVRTPEPAPPAPPAQVTPPPAPQITLTPPALTQIASAPEPKTADTMPKFQLTPPAASEGTTDTQFKFAMFTNGESGANGVIQFGHGSSQLSGKDRRTIGQLAREAIQSGALVRVVGHASMRTRDMDPYKHTIANFNVSLKRANAVARALIEAGVPAEQMIVDAVGDTQPIFSEAMPSGERGNRRAEIFLETS